MISAFHIFEAISYSLLNFFPYLLLALFPFRNSLRFSIRRTSLLIFILTVFQIGIGIRIIIFESEYKSILSITSTLMYGIFYCTAVKARLGKTLFLLLCISNAANFIVMLSKCIEYLFFPEMALASYRITFSICMFCVQCVFIPIFFWFIQKYICPVFAYTNPDNIWRFLWLIPATFYVIWYYHCYFSLMESSPTKIAIRIDNSIFLFLVNVGALFVYYIVCRMIQEMNANLELNMKNQQLSTRNMQYQNLQERIAEARRAKHDLRHHLKIIYSFVEREQHEKLKNYLNEYAQSLPSEAPICFCEHPAVNPLLVWYAGQAKEYNIHFDVRVSIPAKIHVSNPDICVLLGNLLENALDACIAQSHGERIIRVSGGIQSEYVIVFTIDNTYETPIRQTKGGTFLSSKHSAEGLGISSVQNIVSQYNGVASFRYDDTMFYASILFSNC